ncbi:glycoside hydrolase superfamily [Aspergillus keveii]|uniref:Glycoside hydrolase superfamily n=1 Tax=Aspergillus keveii TaxID=714993 RepID=A0ABR4GBF1_9EURO
MAALKIPHLKRTKTSAQLIVKGKPFLMLPCETHNSSFSSSAYMDRLWAELKNCNFNTILGSVSWECIEPHEGHFDFSELDRIILAARGHGLHLVLLWFGAYKNGTSSYAPGWVKRDFGRFPRVRIRGGEAGDASPLKTVEVLSPFSQAAWEADGRAFAALLQHVRDIDEEHSTVLMVQVENECGVLGDSRDRSRLAEEAFAKPVPRSLLQYLAGKEEEEEGGRLHPEFEKRFPELRSAVLDRGAKSWEEVFGQSELADEMLMAAAYANFLGKVCGAGKREYPLPMFANVWLNTNNPSFLDIDDLPGAMGEALAVAGGTKPGAYPSGGPCPHAIDIYRFYAPELDMLAPDVYLQKYEWVCQQYRHASQPLFLPEQRADGRGARRAWLAYGTYAALGCSPFGIDETSARESEFTTPYGLLSKMQTHILEAQANHPEHMIGFFFDEPRDGASPAELQQDSWTHTLGEFRLTITRSFTMGKPTPGYGIIIHRGDGRFLLLGQGFQVSFTSIRASATYTGILDFTELDVDAEGNLSGLRKLNGDQRMGGELAIMPSLEIDRGAFPIWVTQPASTMVAECTAYVIEEPVNGV